MKNDLSNEEAIQLALSFGALQPHEINLAKEILRDHNVGVFMAFLRARETVFRDAEGEIYKQLGTSKEWVDKRLQGEIPTTKRTANE